MKYILSGEESVIKNVIRDCGLLCRRGLIEFTPVEEAESADAKDVVVDDVKAAPEADPKTPKPRNKKSK